MHRRTDFVGVVNILTMRFYYSLASLTMESNLVKSTKALTVL